ncbi:hypothetical protein PGT21_000010 [Puccinia graminis f. sp. tritici]|uniref:Uncharacterized protein n=1 Tax=Puccinia graminis f. sp. tritici TaxID=56615 RepID=A0A5B0N0S2_PUCGR|nr:hypothetical protein PGT21_000010 [Puccinia graminis f. sp. tritici]
MERANRNSATPSSIGLSRKRSLGHGPILSIDAMSKVVTKCLTSPGASTPSEYGNGNLARAAGGSGV